MTCGGAAAAPVAKRQGYDTMLLTNCAERDENLANLIADFAALYPFPLRVVRIKEFPFREGARFSAISFIS